MYDAKVGDVVWTASGPIGQEDSFHEPTEVKIQHQTLAYGRRFFATGYMTPSDGYYLDEQQIYRTKDDAEADYVRSINDEIDRLRRLLPVQKDTNFDHLTASRSLWLVAIKIRDAVNRYRDSKLQNDADEIDRLTHLFNLPIDQMQEMARREIAT